MDEDPSKISDYSLSDRRKALSKTSIRFCKKSGTNKKSDNDEVKMPKRQYKEKNGYLQKLIRRRKAVDDESKAEVLKCKIADSREDLDNIQGQKRESRIHGISVSLRRV